MTSRSPKRTTKGRRSRKRSLPVQPRNMFRPNIDRLREYWTIVYEAIIRMVSSDYFFYAVIALCVFQALWYAASFAPGVNDEARHFATIVVYAQHLSPFLGTQLPAWDHLGAITRDSSFMFYYVLSWPLRLVAVFTDNQTAQLIALRLVCIACFVFGLVTYRLALLQLKLARGVVNGLMLFFVIIPTVAILPATVNYDNMVFLLFAWVLLIAIQTVKRRTVNARELTIFVILGLFMFVIKWTSAPLFLPAAGYLLYDLWRKHGRKLFGAFWTSIRRVHHYQLVVLAISLLIVVGLVIERPVMNVIWYHQVSPDCAVVIGPERCMKFDDYNAYAGLRAQKTSDQKPANIVQYLAIYWVPLMVEKAGNVYEQATTRSPIVYGLFALLGVGGGFLVTVCLQTLLRDRRQQLLLVIIIGYLAFLIFDEYTGYLKYGTAVAIRTRYLIPILPICLYILTVSATGLLRKRKQLLLTGAVISLLLMTQGGGITTFLLTTPQEAYWPNGQVRQINTLARTVVRWFVKI